MEKDLFQNLKELKNIKPDPDYSRQSFHIITLSQRNSAAPRLSFQNIFARIGVVLAIFAVAILLAVKNDVPLKVAGLDPQGLEAEAKDLELQLKLADITYATSQQSAEIALNEAAKNGPGHLNTLIIKKEAAGLNAEEYSNPEIDKALNALAE